MPKSRWQAQHAGCQAAVDNLKADLTKEIERLTAENAELKSATQSAIQEVDQSTQRWATLTSTRQAATQEIERLTKILAQIHAIAVENPQGNDAREAIDTIEDLSRVRR